MKKQYLLLIILFLIGSFSYAQDRVIEGQVVSAIDGLPLIGATVVKKGSTSGVTTDLDGKFKLDISKPEILVVSFIGFAEKEVAVNPDTSGEITISLEEDITRLNEVVVSGLATSVKRSNLGNAVATVSSEELTGITNQPTLDNALYGKVTGVNITSSSGAPGGGIAMRLRGVTSITGNNQPLFIIDGVYVSNDEIPSGLRNASGANSGNEENASNRIADLAPSDIENIEILKGPSAAAIYGSRANAGVVIITTKRGKRGETQVNLSQDIGFSTIQRKVGIGQRDWTAALVESEFGAGEVARYTEALNGRGLVDYEEEIYGETGLISETRISANGGSENTKFYVGASLRDEEGIIKHTGYKRASIRANIDHQLNDRIKFTTSSNFINSKTQRGFTGNENEGGLSMGYNMAFTRPWANLYPDEFGNYPDNPNAAGNMLLVRDKAINDEDINRYIQGASVDVNLWETDQSFLKFKWNGGFDTYSLETYVYVPEYHQAQRGLQNGFIAVGKNNIFNTNNQGFLVWDNYLGGGSLQLTSQVGYAYITFSRDLVYNQATQLIPGQTTLGQSGTQELDQTLQNVKEFGYFAQQEFNYEDKLIGTLGIRADKSTLNADQNQFYYFPKASLALNLANFDFWNFELMNQLKLRAAYGETGSSAGFGSLFTSFQAVNIGGSPGISVGGLRGSEDLIPETASEFETGIDMTLFDNKLSLEASYYNRNIYDLILQRALQPSTGFGLEVTNLADLQNQGLELALNASPVQNENFIWSSTTNFWFNRSKITRMDVPPFAPAGSGFGLGLGTAFIEEGEPVTQLKGTKDGEVITVGDAEPDFQMSFFNSMNFFKNFDFSFLIHVKQGGNNLNLTTFLTDLAGLTGDLDDQSGIDRISNPNTERFIEDASYMRLREIALYYRLPKSAVNVFNGTIKTVKIGASGRNLWTVSDYTGYDPEVSTKGGAGLSTGLDVNPYPSTKQVYFHLALEF
ncbi:SusC/RagA family TonB-linked outer membrane protein [Marivirga sp. S37H4]|uniref:SusC/RagA family TonB-linked outer membrane protein n=1 Tax=Marivirga aurantiaca TaxID=2802615 RepID=A0A935C9L8_9BACT|nr:SusC/RagA family TonB-linked outer membrane protein [Marivirga aurantiaca]MBK6265677.1 SusC/RagA family TonB-linked outer membrane protein [Marivirga aurantiaca]